MLRKSSYFILFFAICFLFACGQSNFKKAVSYHQDGEYNKAIKFYKKAIAAGEDVAVAEKNLGDIYFSTNNYEKAFDNYKKSIEINPDLALEQVIQFISYNDQKVRDLASEALSKVEDPKAKEKLLNTLSEILKSGDQYKIIDALEVISRLGNKAEPLINDIAGLLEQNNIVIKQKALSVFPSMAQKTHEFGITDRIIKFLDSDDEILKVSAIDCLSKMRGYAIKALPIMLYISVNDQNLKSKALSAIDEIGFPTKEQAAAIYPYLKDKSVEIKELVLNRFKKLGQKANIYVPYILPFLNDSDNGIKELTRITLSSIGKASIDTVPELIALLQDQNEEIQQRAIFELGDLGEDAAAATEPLKKLLNDNNNKEIKKYAQSALQKIQK